MNEVPAEFWIAIVTSLTIGVLLVFFYLIEALRKLTATLDESQRSVRKTNLILDTVNLIVTDARDEMIMMMETFGALRRNVFSPLSNIGTVATAVKAFLDGAKGENKSRSRRRGKRSKMVK